MPTDEDGTKVVYIRREDKDGQTALLKWLLGMVSTLVVTGVIGYWNQNERLTRLEERLSSLQEQVGDLRRSVAPRYRGVPETPDVN